jgi:hypothetical protein
MPPVTTPPVTVLKTPSVSLYYHQSSRIVHHEIRRFITGQDFRDLLTAGSDLLRKNAARKWLSDDRGQWVLAKEDLDWSEAHWAPQTAKAGWKYWAIVRAEKVLAKVAMETLVAKYAKLGVKAQFFTDPNDAMAWLEKQV